MNWGDFLILLPDLGNLATFGDNVADACGLHLFTALHDNEPIPAASELNKINPAAILKDFEMESATNSAFVNMVLVDMSEYTRQHSDKAVKKTLTIPSWLNERAIAMGINFSQVLQEALLAKIQT